MRIFVIVIIALLCISTEAQVIVNIDGVPRDTSFNVHDTYLKEVRHRPFIKIAQVERNNSVKEIEGITYSQPVPERELKLNVYRPDDNNKYPVLLMVYGGGWSSGNLSMEIPLARAIAAKGYVTIPVEYRLSPEAQYPAAVHDLKTAVRWIRANAKKYGIDTAQIAISGESAGGQLASLIGTTNGQQSYEGCGEYMDQSSTVHAVINIDGSLDFTVPEAVERVNTDVGKGKQPASVRWFGGTYADRRGMWIAASPLFQVTERSAPICFINSSIPRFHDGRDAMIAELAKYNTYTEVFTMEDTPHTFWLFHPWFDQTVSYMTDFLGKQFSNDNK